MSIQRGTKEETILTRLRILLVNYLISSFGNKKNLNESKSCLKSKFDFMRAASCRYTFSCCTSKLPLKIYRLSAEVKLGQLLHAISVRLKVNPFMVSRQLF